MKRSQANYEIAEDGSHQRSRRGVSVEQLQKEYLRKPPGTDRDVVDGFEDAHKEDKQISKWLRMVATNEAEEVSVEQLQKWVFQEATSGRCSVSGWL